MKINWRCKSDDSVEKKWMSVSPTQTETYIYTLNKLQRMIALTKEILQEYYDPKTKFFFII